jgi:hypothetical protein
MSSLKDSDYPPDASLSTGTTTAAIKGFDDALEKIGGIGNKISSLQRSSLHRSLG